MNTVPIANEATMYSTVMCPATSTYRSERSPGLELCLAHGFDGELCAICCAEGCEEPTSCAQEAAAGVAPRWASLARRRGGGYYCAKHLVLAVDEFSTQTPV